MNWCFELGTEKAKKKSILFSQTFSTNLKEAHQAATYSNTVISWGCYICDSSPSLWVKCKSVLQQGIFMYNTKYISSSHVVTDLNINKNRTVLQEQS